MNPLALFPPPARAMSRHNNGNPPPRPQSRGNSISLSRLTSRSQGGHARTDSSATIGSTNPEAAASSSASSKSAPGSGRNSIHNEAGALTGLSQAQGGPSDSSPNEGSRGSTPPIASSSGAESDTPGPTPTKAKSSGTNAAYAARGGAARTMEPRRPDTAGSNSSRKTSSASIPQQEGKLPVGMYFDFVRPEEIGIAYRLEREGFPQEDAATLDKLQYRQRAAPHLFLGAFIPGAPPKIAGPLSISAHPPRRLIAYACSTAASALTQRSMSVHSVDEDAWLVCLHSVCVSKEFRHRGIALKLLEEYTRRIQLAESGKGDKKAGYVPRGYECIALLAHEELVPLYNKAGFEVLGHSHVQHGSGGWLEMRKRIVPKKERPAEEAPEAVAMSTRSNSASSTSPSNSPAQATPSDGAGTPKELSRLSMASPGEDASASPSASGFIDDKVTQSPAADSDKAAWPSASGVASEGVEVTPKASTAPAAKAPSSSGSSSAGFPAGITQEKLLAALRQQSSSFSSDSSGGRGPVSPGQAYSSILGQALAAKTTVEEPYHALEARLVNREDNSNLADLYCPREECACKLVSRGTAEWEMAEMGPLAQPNLKLPNTKAPPAPPIPPPVPASLSRVRSAFGCALPSVASTPIRGFWSLVSPLSFDNISFSKDDTWTPPPLPPASGPGSPLMSDEDSEGSLGAGGFSPPPKKKGGLKLFRAASERRKEKEREEQREAVENARAASAPTVEPQRAIGPVKVKYLLCPECDCGPLGYVVLSASTQDGGLARQVGEQIGGPIKEEDEKEGGTAAEEAKEEPAEGAAEPKREILLYLLASDRLRYRLQPK